MALLAALRYWLIKFLSADWPGVGAGGGGGEVVVPAAAAGVDVVALTTLRLRGGRLKGRPGGEVTPGGVVVIAGGGVGFLLGERGGRGIGGGRVGLLGFGGGLLVWLLLPLLLEFGFAAIKRLIAFIFCFCKTAQEIKIFRVFLSRK